MFGKTMESDVHKKSMSVED